MILKIEDIFKAKCISVNQTVAIHTGHPLFFWLQTSGVYVDEKFRQQLFNRGIHIYHPPKFNHLIFLK